MRPQGSELELADRRNQAMALVAAGFSVRKVAWRLGVTRRTVWRWKALYRRERGLQVCPTPGASIKGMPAAASVR